MQNTRTNLRHTHTLKASFGHMTRTWPDSS